MMSPVATVAVGMSGGVDSAVAALLLQQTNYRVFGIFMKNWEEDDHEECQASEDLHYAEQICQQLHIRLHTVNFSSEYWERVFDICLNEYRAGRTPNPDILCNQEIKFKEFLRHAQSLGADKIATGHYAGIAKSSHSFHLLKGQDENKDQSYFLHRIEHDALANTLFPLSTLTKQTVRNIAAQADFANAKRKDSTGICFIGERKFRQFLERFITAETGDIVDENGRILGRHHGVAFYTIGQRHGLGIGGVGDGSNQAWYVAEKDSKKNRLIVVQGHEHRALYKTTLLADQIHWINHPPEKSDAIYAKVRYQQKPHACRLTDTGNYIQVTFAEPIWAITPGQSVVFYHNSECLGGAVISSDQA